jgi:NADH-quinone oxidoreductase subunit L
MQQALPALPNPGGARAADVPWLEFLYVVIGLAGIPIGWMITRGKTHSVKNLLESAPARMLHRFWSSGWGFDWLYDRTLVRPFVWLARLNRNDLVDEIYQALASVTEFSAVAVRSTQTGQLRWYTLALALGAIVILAIVLIL